jgi:hypothetical protein
MQTEQSQPSKDNLQTSPTFNPLTHIPPSYDIYGHQIPTNPNENKFNILAEKDSIKIPWETRNKLYQSTPMTRTKLLERRKKERIPDISYDLDGDGFVGGRDYVLAKRYDVDGDGKLNEIERKNALEGIKNGVEKEYVWNLESQGGKRAFRILQKRGKIIDAEDFIPLQESYPKHPISFKEPKNGIKTLAELKEYRIKKTKEEINEKIKNFEKKHPIKLVKESYHFENRTKPLYNSIHEIKDKLHREARIKAGLSEKETDIKIVNHDPTLAYVYSPKHKVKEDIRKDLLKESKDISNILNSKKHLNDTERLKIREDEIFDKLYHKDEGFTYTKLKEIRRIKQNEYNLKTFAEHPKGVHGHELPKFSANENTKEFWKFQDGYVENPKHKSQFEYLQEIKYWKKPEELLLNEHRDYVEPKQFKRSFTLPNKKDEYTPNINKINFYKGFDPNYIKPVEYKIKSDHNYRWTSLVGKFCSGNFKSGRLFDFLEQEDQKKELEKIPKVKTVDEKKDEKNNEIAKNKADVEIQIPMPLLQKFGTKESLILNSATNIRNKGF